MAILAALLVTARSVLEYLGPKDGCYTGSYRYLGSDWRWHEVRKGASITALPRVYHYGLISNNGEVSSDPGSAPPHAVNGGP